MIVVLVVLAVALVAVVVTSAELVRSQQRAHARREDLLIAQVLHLTGKPWIEAPAEAKPAEAEWEPQPVRFTATPEAFV